jgi:prepilin-type N-terminal cleavage/methylation domain-containing protein
VKAPARGFTLVEVLVASAVLTVGFAGLASMLALSSYGVREGRYRSVAVALADARAEQITAALWDASGDCLGLSASSALPPVTVACPGHGAGHAPFPDELAGTLPPPFDQFARAVRVQSCAAPGACPVATPDLRRVTVVVSYTPISALGGRLAGLHQSVAVSRLVGRKS